MNHYCTYFDRGFLIQGVALARSLTRHDPGAVLWVLALDDFTGEVLREIGGPGIRVVALSTLESSDPELKTAKANRSRVEYFFTLSPCWPRSLLQTHPDIERITYIDADMLFFSSPAPIFAAMEETRASVLITAHRFPQWLRHYERHGVFNVGVESFRNDAPGRACLDDWRRRCLEWCYDRLEAGRYADQKYLDAWPQQWGESLQVLAHPGVNLAPWNWPRHRIAVSHSGVVSVDDSPLVLFHFARFRPIFGDRWWQSGQLDYGVMPWRIRNAIYAPYWRALQAARVEIRAKRPDFGFPQRSARLGRDFWRGLTLRAIWGSDWLRIGDRFFAGRFGLGRWSGQSLAKLRTIFLRT